MTRGLEKFCSIFAKSKSLEAIRQDALKNADEYGVYPESINEVKGCALFLAKVGDKKRLIIVEIQSCREKVEFEIEEERIIEGKNVKLAALTHHNANVLRKLLPYTSPVAFGKHGMSMGLGDRLGLASPGHLRIVKSTGVRPVLAQQSIRELNLTHRTYEDVLNAASWAVFQEGYKEGFGADGDHLKTEEEVKMALNLGFSMITLDCSEKIKNTVPGMTHAELKGAYMNLEKEYLDDIEDKYLDREFVAGGFKLMYDRDTLQSIVLIYKEALDFIKHIYFDVIKPIGREVDFEISIDETQTPTTPEAHFFVASELEKMGVDATSLAPRFCGEFQKGIDYIGDIAEFEREFKIHAKIADKFGYRLSIHSGSDKFKVFPIIGKYTKGRVHVKTAGTNWLEALRVIAKENPKFFRKIYAFALEHFEEAREYYYVTTDLSKVPNIEKMNDNELPEVLAQNDARQMLHITYGLILTAKDFDDQYLLRDEFFDIMQQFEEEYCDTLKQHIGKHIKLLQ